MRARYFILRCLPEDLPDSRLFRCTWDEWWQQLVVESTGDAALVFNDLRAAREAFGSLLAAGEAPTHTL